MYPSIRSNDEQQYQKRNTAAAPDEPALCIVLPALPDEALISVVARFHILSGNTTVKNTFHELFNCTPFNLSAWIPPHIEALAQRLGSDIDRHTLDVLRSNTLYPLVTIFGGVASWPITSKKHITSTLRCSVPQPVRLCLRCLHEDMAVFGVRYIHLSHQVPGVEVCSKHSISLIYKCPFCERLILNPHGELILLPWRQCICNNFVFNTSETQAQIEDSFALSYAKFTEELLTSKINAVPSSVLVECYKLRAREIGFEWRSDKVNRAQLMIEMEKFYGKEFLSRADVAYRRQRLACWFRMLGNTTAAEPPLGRHLLFAYFLFRKAVDFRAALDSLANENQIEIEPKPPKAKRKSKISPNDNKIAWKILKESATLYSSYDKPEKVTKNRIIRYLGWKPYSQNKYTFPKSINALEEAAESSWHFYARRIVWAKLAYKFVSDIQVRRLSGVEYQRSVVLMEFFRDIDLSVSLGPGVITKLLRDLGIYRNWEGPCPERSFAPSGRRFYQKI